MSMPRPMEGILSSLESKYLDFKLGDEQKDVLLSVFYFIKDKDKRQCTLDGFGGSGKTTLTKLIIRFLEQERIDYVIAAPTHKAKGVISSLTERDATTIHQLLTLKPTIDIMNLDYKDLRFISKTLNDGVPRNGIIIVDECSMVNEVLFDYIVERAETQNTKIIWVGDYAQICPVKENKLSKAFSISDVFKLTKVYRQKGDNPLLDILYELRNEPKQIFNQIESNAGSLMLYNNWHSFISNNINLFEEMIKEELPTKVKLIAYTNKRVEAFNNIIRNELFKNNNEYNVGDMLMGYDSCEYKSNGFIGNKITNSEDYLIREVIQSNAMIAGISVSGYILTLYSFEEEYEFNIFILSRENTIETFTHIAAAIEDIRLYAISIPEKRKRNSVWKQYFQLMSSFLTPYDLIFDGRVVRKKSLDYGYSITSHKSQGSTYDKVLIDMENILRCYNQMELRQLQYVAMSRTRKDIDMLLNIK